MNVLLLKGYNNYFNRILKTETSLNAYKTASTSYLEFGGINFVYNDGVATELVIGGPTQTEGNSLLSWDQNGAPDYLIAWERENSQDFIRSRWFVIESVKTRKGQYKVSLRRDLLADYKDEVLEAPCFVEKGTINDVNNPLLLNPEGMSFNQIKTNEQVITDETKTSWLVGYLNKNQTVADINAELPGQEFGKYYDVDELDWADCIDYYDENEVLEPGGARTKNPVWLKAIPAYYFTIYNPYAFVYYRVKGGGDTNSAISAEHIYDWEYVEVSNTPNYKSTTSAALRFTQNKTPGTTYDENLMIEFYNSCLKLNSYPAYAKTAFNIMSSACIQAMLDEHNALHFPTGGQWGYSWWHNKVIKKGNNYYRLKISDTDADKWIKSFNIQDSDTASVAVRNFFTNMASAVNWADNITYSELALNTTDSSRRKISFEQSAYPLQVRAVKISTATTIHASIPSTANRNTAVDSQFDAFCIPFVSTDVMRFMYKENGTTGSASINPDVSLFAANTIITNLDTNGYDLQLLPYCPFELSVEDNVIDLTTLSDKAYTLIKQDTTVVGFILYPDKLNFTKNIGLVKNLNTTDRTRIIVQENTYEFKAVYDGETVEYLTNYDDPIVLDEAINEDDIASLIVDINHNIDAQILEYFLKSHTELVLIVDNGWLPEGASTVYLDVSADITLETVHNPTALELKISNETDFLRFTSPNFNSMFECKLTKFRNSEITNVNVDCTYKPFSPYIKLNPDFSYLYGQDFNDSTGLILKGDFSLPRTKDAWINYELNNKNYEAIFNRQLASIDINQDIQREQFDYTAMMGLATSTLGGAAGGAKMGADTGNAALMGAGAIAGGALAGIASGLGYTKDVNWLNRSLSEQRSNAIDQYRFKLGNVKALPQTITKSTPLTFNNKVWPILEEFSCTEAEKEICKDKLTWDGMTINAIGTLSDYYGNYLRGRLIRLNINDDAHVANEVSRIVAGGFYTND